MLNQWFKFYGLEYLSDLKIKQLNSQERSCLITLFSYASISTIPGIVKNLPEATLKMEAGCADYDGKVYEKLQSLNIIKCIDATSIQIINWNKRQEYTMSATERSRKHRALQGEMQRNATSETDCNENATLEKNRIEQNREEEIRNGDVAPTTSSSKSESKKSKKERLNGGYSVVFEAFWENYPNKVAKGKAYEVFVLLNADIQEKCVEAIQNQNQNNHFWKDWIINSDGSTGADSPPHATTWLNQKRWEDVVKFIERKGKSGSSQPTFKTYG